MREIGQRGDLHVLGVAGDRAHLEAGPAEQRGIVGERGARRFGLGVRLPERGRPERLGRLTEHELLPRLHALDDLAAHAEHRVGDGQYGDRAVGALHTLDDAREEIGGCERPRRVVDGHDVHGLGNRRERLPDRSLPRVAALDEPDVDPEVLHARARASLPSRREGHDESADGGSGRGGGGGDREDRAAPDREQRLRLHPAEPTAGAGSQEDHDRRVGLHRRSIADGDAQASAPAVAGASPERAAKIMRPVVVWITFVTRTSTCEPIRSAACSTTTIVPSSR